MLCARRHVGDQPFAVLLGDDLIDPREDLLTRMLDVRDRHGGSVVALMEVPPEQIHPYGCAAVRRTGEEDVAGSRDWSRSRRARPRRAVTPSSAAMSSPSRSSASWSARHRAAAARSS